MAIGRGIRGRRTNLHWNSSSRAQLCFLWPVLLRNTKLAMSATHEKLPDSVLALLRSGKFVHLGTASKQGIPDVALMNYYYLPSNELFGHQESSSSIDKATNHTYITLATAKSSLKFKNIEENSNVSLLFHDWTTAKNIYKSSHSDNEQSNLLKLLQGLNQSELSQVSATLTGEAKIITDEDELAYYKTKLANENPDAKVFIDGDSNAIVLVHITSAKVCDSHYHQSVYK